jgi:hypothetical protein
MKPPFGVISQNAFVVADIDAAIDYWERTMHVGPFFKFPKIEFSEADYRGRKASPDFEAAIAYSGDLNIELIRPKGPSIFLEYAQAGGKGIHHFGAFVDDFGTAAAALEQRGGKRIQGGGFADGSAIAYYDMGGPEPSIIEIAYLKEGPTALFAAVKAAGAAWDGKTRTITF